MADGTVTIDILLNDGSVVKGTANVKNAFDGLKGKAEGTGSGIKKAFTFGAAFSLAQKGISAIGDGIKVFGKASIGAAADFEQTMSLVQANSNASSKEMEKLNQLAKQLGADTKFSAGEAAGAILELSKAGITPAQIEAGALKATMDLAAASGMNLGDAANVTANALNTFHMDASEAVRVADALAGAANASSADVSDLAQGLAQVGPVAAQMGLDINDTAGALAMFSQNGMKGSDAGTSLKTMLMNLQPTSKQQIALFERLGLSSAELVTEQNELGNAFINSDGSFKSFSEISGVLNDKLKDLSAAQKAQALETIFGSDAVRAATIATTEGAKGFDKYRKATEEQGAAQKMADAYMKGFRGTLEQLQGALETLGMSIGERVLPLLTQMMAKASEVVDCLANNIDVVISFGVALAAGAAALTAYSIVSMVTASIAAFKKANEGATVAQWALNVAMSANPVAILVFALSALTAGLVFFFTQTETGKKAWEELSTNFMNFASKILPTVKTAWSSVTQAMQPFISMISGGISSAISLFVSLFNQAKGSISGFKVDAMSIVSVITTIGTVSLGVTGPIGIAIGLLAKFAVAFAQTGNASKAIQMVADNITNTINAVGTLLPEFIQMGTNLITNLIKGMLSALPNIITTITQVITTLTQSIVQHLPQITQTIIRLINMVSTTLNTYIPVFVKAGIEILNSLITGILQALPQFVTAITQIISNLTTAFSNAIPQLLEVGTQIIDGLVQVLPQIVNAMTQIIEAFISAIVPLLPSLIEAGIQIITALINGLIAALPQIIQAGIQLLMALIQGIIQVLPLLIKAALQIIMALVNAIVPLIPTLIRAGIQILMALIQGIISILPALIDAAIKIIVALVNGLIQALPQLLAAGVQLIIALVKAIVQLAPQLLAAGVTIFAALIRGIGSLLGQLLAMGVRLLGRLIRTIGGFAGQMLAKGVQLITSIIAGMGSMVGSAVAKIASLGIQIVGKIGSFVGQMLSKGAQLISNVANGIGNGIGGAVGKVADLGHQLVDKVSGFAGEMLSAGGNLIAGFADGIANGASKAIQAAANAAKGAVDKVKSLLGIHSPSRVFRDEVGKFIPAGIAVGIDANSREITKSLTDMQKEMLLTMNPESSLNIGNARGLRQAGQVISNTFMPQFVPVSSTSNTFKTTIIAPEKPSEREYVRLQKNTWRDMARQIP